MFSYCFDLMSYSFDLFFGISTYNTFEFPVVMWISNYKICLILYHHINSWVFSVASLDNLLMIIFQK